MRSFYHIDFTVPARPLQQCMQLRQSFTADTRRIRDTHKPTSGCIEHPLRDGQGSPQRCLLLESTVEDRLTALSYRGVNRNVTIEPRMPRILENTQLGNMGLMLLGCTTPGAVTAHWTDAPRMRCTSTRATTNEWPETDRRFPFSYCPKNGVHFCW